jgi:hypothetical protein
VARHFPITRLIAYRLTSRRGWEDAVKDITTFG